MPTPSRRAVKLGLVSDTHDHAAVVAHAVRTFREHGVEFVLHAGDVTRPETLRAFAEWPGAVAFGNNDDAHVLASVATAMGWEAGWAWRGDVDSVSVGVVHGHRKGLLRRYLHAEKVDVLVRGHNHRQQDETVDGVRVVNPGALFRARTYSVGVLDTASGALELVTLPKS